MSPTRLGLLLAAGLGSIGLLWLGAPGATSPAPAPHVALPRPAPVGTSQGAPGVPMETPGLEQALDAFLAGVPIAPVTSRGGAAQARLEEVLRASGEDPLAQRQALEQVLREQDEASPLLAGLLLADEVSPEALLFQRALALASHLDEAGADQLLSGLPHAGPRARAAAVFALRGRRDLPRVQAELLRRYAEDPHPAVRARAGFVLGEAGAALPPEALARARSVARTDLLSDDPQLIESAADLLGVPPLAGGDRELLLDTLTRDRSSPRRLAALRALASGGVPPSELRAPLARIAADPHADQALRAAARATLSE